MATCDCGCGGQGWAVYARLSRLKKGRAGKLRNSYETVEGQIKEVRKWAAAEGVPICERHIYVDNNLTAWKEDGPRPAFDAMLSAAMAGEFPGMSAYKLDRYARNGHDGRALEKLGDHGLVIDGPNSGRLRLRTARGRKDLRDAISDAEYESDQISERVRDALTRRAEMGLQIGGGRLFGFEILSEVREYDDETEPVKRTAEVEIVREVARRFLAAEPFAHIARDLNRRADEARAAGLDPSVMGLTTVRGGRFTGPNLARMLGSPRYAGLVVLHGKIVGRNEGDPVLDMDTYRQVRKILDERKRGRRPAGKYKLSRIVRCGNPACTKPEPRTMTGYQSATDKAPRKYLCSAQLDGCGTSILAGPVEDIVRARVLEVANQPLARTELARREQVTAELAEIDSELQHLAVERTALRLDKIHKRVSDDEWATAVAEIDRLAQGLERRRVQMPSPVPSEPLTPEAYDEMSPLELRSLMDSYHLAVSVTPQIPGAVRNRFNADRVLVWKVKPSGVPE